LRIPVAQPAVLFAFRAQFQQALGVAECGIVCPEGRACRVVWIVSQGGGAMAAPKGHPRWGGKQKGSKNYAMREGEQRLVQALAAEQLSPEQQAEIAPLHVMLRIMRARDRAGDDAGALAAAIAAAPCCHARLSSSDMHVSGSLDGKNDADLAAELAAVEAKLAATGRLH
jgi:hypothetical protein